MIAAIERGLDYSAIKKMSIGQLVDFCIEYNNRQNNEKDEKKKPVKRWANQNDINAFFGG